MADPHQQCATAYCQAQVITLPSAPPFCALAAILAAAVLLQAGEVAHLLVLVARIERHISIPHTAQSKLVQQRFLGLVHPFDRA